MPVFSISSKAVREGASVTVVINGVDVALFNIDGRIHAVKNKCPHQQFRMLHEGEICDGAVTCPMHGWTFDLETGDARTGQGKMTVYPVTVKGDEVFVDVPAQ